MIFLVAIFGTSDPTVDDTPVDSTTTAMQIPDGTVTEQVITASLDEDTVDAFCEKHGYRAGYPTTTTGDQYMITCYDDQDGQRVRKAFPMFKDFADYVQGDTR
ncbi:hypothetical protein [Natrinema amylolyticum]|uniref:hypothetical protein n=1 Tax=Natrinema amylolyticum TaxID=2878679 RepID=UPI001CFB9A0F|nr:hypothetical protein [Natrinema amylolyticum]